MLFLPSLYHFHFFLPKDNLYFLFGIFVHLRSGVDLGGKVQGVRFYNIGRVEFPKGDWLFRTFHGRAESAKGGVLQINALGKGLTLRPNV